MVERSVDFAAAAMNAEIRPGLAGGSKWSGASIDSRTLAEGELFFALAGERTHGHRFVDSALERGAAAAVVGPDWDQEGPFLRVEDPYRGLHDLTRAVRAKVPEKLVAITGSAGKTTTKEALAAFMGTTWRVAKSRGNFNNLYGFPVSLLAIPDDTEWMVAEMGMSTPGELSQVSELGRPDVAVFTNIRPAHLEGLGSLEAVAEAKGELLDGLKNGGLVVANAEEVHLRNLLRRHSGEIVWFGESGGFRSRQVEMRDGRARFVLETPRGSRRIETGLYGRYNVENILAAAAVAVSLGVALDRVAEVAATLEATGSRGRLRRASADFLIVDDSYNSNPSAVERALESARELKGARHWAVLGDMLELGAEAERFHREIANRASDAGFRVVAVGKLARHMADEIACAWYPNAKKAAEAMASEVRTGDVVLVKGSRGVGLETVVTRLLAEEGG